MQQHEEMNALSNVLKVGQQVMLEAAERKADLKQGRLASEACGRVVAATKTMLEYRLAAPKLAEIEAKLINGAASAPRKSIAKKKAA